MNNFRFDNRSRGGRDSSRRSFGGGDSRRPPLYDAVCDDCGQPCQVPFRPSGDRPIYCRDCFEKRGGGNSERPSRGDFRNRSFDGRDSRRPSQSGLSEPNLSRLTEQIEILNTKLDKVVNLLSKSDKEQPAFAKNQAKDKKKPKQK